MFLHFIDLLFTLVQESQSGCKPYTRQKIPMDASDVVSHHSRIFSDFTLNVYIHTYVIRLHLGTLWTRALRMFQILQTPLGQLLTIK